ncbi:MAG: DUF4167 domain-containing protein [Paracoccaceae bacterium]
MRSSQKSNRNRSKNRPKSLGNVANRVFESAGPEGKVRGTPQQIIDKYEQLARDSQTSGDRVTAENFLQHAEHYARMLSAAQAEQQAQQERQAQQQSQQEGRKEPQQGGGDDKPRREDEPRARREDDARGETGGGQGGLETIDTAEDGDSLVATPEAGREGEGADQPAGEGGEGAAKPGRSARRRRSRTRDRQDGGEGESDGGSDVQPTASEAASG